MSEATAPRCARGVVAVLCLALLSVLLAGCGRTVSDADAAASVAEDAADEPELEPEPEPEPESEPLKIACWGDSLTEGIGVSEAYIETDDVSFDASYLSYPEILEQMTGLRTFNRGVSGATSEEIVAMALDVNPPEGVEMEYFSTRVAKRAHKHPGDILVVEMGSNGGWDGDYAVLIDQYYTLIAATGCKDFLIVGDTDDPGTSLADVGQEPFEEGSGVGRTAWEAVLRAEFGDRFINMRRYLILYGLKACGLQETEEDVALAQCGCVSPQLRADWTHLNSYGYYVQARAVYRRGVQLGFWE